MNDQSNDEPTFVTTLAHAAADPFRLLVEGVKDYGIFLLDPAGNVSSWNPGAEKIKGYKAEEVIGNTFMLLPRRRRGSGQATATIAKRT